MILARARFCPVLEGKLLYSRLLSQLALAWREERNGMVLAKGSIPLMGVGWGCTESFFFSLSSKWERFYPAHSKHIGILAIFYYCCFYIIGCV